MAFFLIYNKIANANLNSRYNQDKIPKSRNIIIKFIIYVINFCTKKNLSKKFKYNF